MPSPLARPLHKAVMATVIMWVVGPFAGRSWDFAPAGIMRIDCHAAVSTVIARRRLYAQHANVTWARFLASVKKRKRESP
jgi:hypothetical protein